MYWQNIVLTTSVYFNIYCYVVEYTRTLHRNLLSFYKLRQQIFGLFKYKLSRMFNIVGAAFIILFHRDC